MHNVVEMAVVNASEDLLGQNGGVSLTELSSLKDLVEELSSLADSVEDHKIWGNRLTQ